MTTIQASSLFSLAILVVLCSAALLAGWFIIVSDMLKYVDDNTDTPFFENAKNVWVNLDSVERWIVCILTMLLALGFHNLCVAVRYLVS